MNRDISFNIALYIQYNHLNNFIMVSKTTILLYTNQYFWVTKYHYDCLPDISENYSINEYYKLSQYKKNAEFILLINDIEHYRKIDQTDGVIFSVPSSLETRYRLLTNKTSALMTNFTVNSKHVIDQFHIVIDKASDKCTISYLYKGEQDRCCTKNEIISIMIISMYYTWKFVDSKQIEFLPVNKEFISKDEDDVYIDWEYNGDLERVFNKRISIIDTLAYLA
jgi:hypothetical protein